MLRKELIKTNAYLEFQQSNPIDLLHIIDFYSNLKVNFVLEEINENTISLSIPFSDLYNNCVEISKFELYPIRSYEALKNNGSGISTQIIFSDLGRFYYGHSIKILDIIESVSLLYGIYDKTYYIIKRNNQKENKYDVYKILHSLVYDHPAEKYGFMPEDLIILDMIYRRDLEDKPEFYEDFKKLWKILS